MDSTLPPSNTLLLTARANVSAEPDAIVTAANIFRSSENCPSAAEDIVPVSYDQRDQLLAYLPVVQDQGTCGSCWAFASTAALASRGAMFCSVHYVAISAEYLVLCARASLSETDRPQFGCSGGSLLEAYEFLFKNGTVRQSCLGYTLTNWVSGSEQVRKRQVNGIEISCPLTVCPQTGQEVQRYFFGHQPYIVPGTTAQAPGGSEKNIRVELYYNGPVATGFQVHEDFYDYWRLLVAGKLKGVNQIYQYDGSSPKVGGHAVIIVGWGEENNVKYWICQNSWGADESKAGRAFIHDYGANGYFKFLRGTNQNDFESNVVTALPVLPVPKGAKKTSCVRVDGLPAADIPGFWCNQVTVQIDEKTIRDLGLPGLVQLGPRPKTPEADVPAQDLLIHKVDCGPEWDYQCGNGLCVLNKAECHGLGSMPVKKRVKKDGVKVGQWLPWFIMGLLLVGLSVGWGISAKRKSLSPLPKDV